MSVFKKEKKHRIKTVNDEEEEERNVVTTVTFGN